MTDLSVIIPIYNTPEEELKRCFSSLSGISGLSWEAILIDDGSEPRVGDFCKAYVLTDPRFKYYYKENGGVSSARNAGIDHATGAYITFVDADDQVIPEVFSPGILKEEPALILFNIELDGSCWLSLELPEGTVDAWHLHQRLTVAKSLNSPCAKLFSGKLIRQHNLRFDPAYVTGEDWSFVWDFCSHIRQIQYCRSCCYRYYRNAGSSLGRIRKFPDKMLQNQLMILEKKETQLPEMYPDRDTASALEQAAAIAVEDLFNLAADLFLMKLLSKPRKSILRKNVRRILSQYPHLPKKAKLKGWVVASCWAALPPLAFARRQYLK